MDRTIEVRLFVRANQAFCYCPTTLTQSTFFGLCLQVFRQTGPPQCVAKENKREVSFLRTQQRIASSEIESGVSNFSIANSTLYQLSYRHGTIKFKSKDQFETKAKHIFEKSISAQRINNGSTIQYMLLTNL